MGIVLVLWFAEVKRVPREGTREINRRNVITKELWVQNRVNIYDHVENVIERISRQIEAKYKVGFKYFSCEQWRELEVSKNIPIANSTEPIRVSIVVADTDTYLPIVIRGELACTIKLSNTTHLTGAELSEISEAVDALIGGSVDMLQRTESLDHDLYYKEKHLREDVLDTEVADNVVSIEKFAYLRKDNQPVIIEEEPKETILGDLPVFVQASSAEQIRRLGHEIFTYTKKIACLSLEDLRKPSEDLTPEFLQSLGPICLIVAEIANLSQESMDVITEYLLAQKRESRNDLLLIFGTTFQPAELINSKKISLNFYRLISAARINHLEDDLTQDHLATHMQSLLRSQKDLYVLTLLSQMGLTAFNVDDLV